MRILVVEDDLRVASFIAKGFQQEGHAVDVVHDGEVGAYQATNHDYDVVVLDLMLPKLSGFDVITQIRAKKRRLPVIMLSAKGEVDDRITGLNKGADDYMTKPFAFTELSARVRSVLRRGISESTTLTVADLELDTATRIVTRAGQRIELRSKEYALLELMMRNVHRPLTRNMIIEHVWDIHFDSATNVIDVHINSLRNKVDKNFSLPLIHTIRGVGYQLTDREE